MKIYLIKRIQHPTKCSKCNDYIEKGEGCGFAVKSFRGTPYREFYHEKCISKEVGGDGKNNIADKAD